MEEQGGLKVGLGEELLIFAGRRKKEEAAGAERAIQLADVGGLSRWATRSVLVEVADGLGLWFPVATVALVRLQVGRWDNMGPLRLDWPGLGRRCGSSRTDCNFRL